MANNMFKLDNENYEMALRLEVTSASISEWSKYHQHQILRSLE